MEGEQEFLLERSYECPICDKPIPTKMVKTKVAKFVDTCADLRPIHSNVNPTKYDVISCHHCGYTALTKYFNSTTTTQRKLLREKIQANFKSREEIPCEYYTTEQSISRLKMALLCTVSKGGKDGEIGEICLKISWLYQDLVDELDPSNPDYESKKESYLSESKTASFNALDHLLKARASESFPIAGMNEFTLDYLLAYLCYEKEDYAQARQLISSVMSTRSLTPRLKEKTLELKELILAHDSTVDEAEENS